MMNLNKKALSLAIFIAAFLFYGNLLYAKTLRVAIVKDGDCAQSKQLVETIKSELQKLVSEDDAIIFPENFQHDCTWNTGEIDKHLNEAQNNSKIDVVLAVGPVASSRLCELENKKKASFASYVFNADILKLSENQLKKLNFIDLKVDFSEQMAKFQEVKIFNRLAVIIDDYLAKGIPEMIENFKETAKKQQLEISFLKPEEVLADKGRVLSGFEAVYLTPMPGLNEKERLNLFETINAMALPSMNMLGSIAVEQGLLISTNDEIDIAKLARRLALNLQRLIFEDDPSSFETTFYMIERLYINMKTARRIGIYPTWSQMTDAVIFNAEPEHVEKKLSLIQVMETAVIRNLQLAAKRQEIEAATQGVERARSSLKPKLSLFGRENAIDEDRAESIMSPAKYTAQIGADLMHVISSEQASAHVDIQKFMLAAKKEEERAMILDIMRDAAIAYLNVLKAKTLQSIQQDNLEVTRANLEMAKLREEVGTSGPAEVYRWEIQMVSAKQAIIDASVMRKKAELALNQILNASQEEEFTTADCDIFDKVFLLDQKQFAPYIDNIFGFRIFRDFMVNDTMARSPEIQQMEKIVLAQKRAHRSAKRRFNQPTVAVQGNFTRTLKEAGVGEPKPPLPAPFSSMLKYPNKNDWYVGVNVSFPIYEGGDRPAAVKQAKANIRQVEENLRLLRQKLELNTRATLEDARSSFSSIGLSNTRTEYAAKTLELVQNAYSRGAVNILDLIDAQNALLVSKEASANAMFNFFSDFVRVCRAVGSYDFILKEDSHEEWRRRLKEYYDTNAAHAVVQRKPALKKPLIKPDKKEKVLFRDENTGY
ncbi:MAG: TolC family protein [Candidatus Rifleibacteriota bacterium]